MNHLTPDEHVDALDDTLSGERLEHWRTCAPCRAQTEQLRTVLRGMPTDPVPEPSPLFWTQFSDRVRDVIADLDAQAAPPRPLWLRWQLLAPLAAAVLVVAALLLLTPHHRRHALPPPNDAATASTIVDGQGGAIDDSFDDGSWRIVVDLVDDLEPGVAPADGLMPTPGMADRALGDLRPAEREELLRLLRAELGDPES